MNELATHLKPGQLGAVHPSEEGSRRRNVACARQFRRRVLSTDLKLEDEYQMEKLFEEMTAERAKKTS